ncbi:MAG: thioesterase family protein [Acidimicrobiales bacterium]
MTREPSGGAPHTHEPEGMDEGFVADERAVDDAGAPRDPVGRLLELFDLTEVGADAFEAPNPVRGFGDRVFGGQVAAQALRAAQRTAPPDHHAHSIHASFLLGGRPGEPLVYEVDRLRDGRSFTTRRVEARQGDDRIFTLIASFHRDEPGVDYQTPLPTDVPAPEDAPTRMLFVPESERPKLPFELREIGGVEPDEQGWIRSTRRAWMRLIRPIGDEPGLHQVLLAYFSDLGAVYAAWAPLPEQPLDRLMGASLDHAMWFHRPIRADAWFLYDAHAVSNAGSRGLMRGTLHAADGTLGVSIAQEALLRVVRPTP